MSAFRPNLILSITVIVAILILLSLAQEMNRRWQVQQEIAKLENEINSMEKRVVELEQLNEYFSTPDYKERLAREQLNFRAPEEKVVLLSEQDAKQVEAKSAAKKQEEKPRSLPLEWWYLFFVDRPTS